MAVKDYSKEIRFLLQLRLSKLRRSSLDTLTYIQIERTVYNTCWKKRVPVHLNEIARDIDSISADDIVNYLTRENLVTRFDLSELASSLEGDKYEKKQ